MKDQPSIVQSGHLSPDEEALRSATSQSIPNIYANGFQIGLSNSDAFIVFQRQGQPTAVLNISYTLAKTLHTKLSTVVTEFEALTKRNMLTTDDVDAAFAQQIKPSP